MHTPTSGRGIQIHDMSLRGEDCVRHNLVSFVLDRDSYATEKQKSYHFTRLYKIAYEYPHSNFHIRSSLLHEDLLIMSRRAT